MLVNHKLKNIFPIICYHVQNYVVGIENYYWQMN